MNKLTAKNINEIAEKIQEVLDQGCLPILLKHLLGDDESFSAIALEVIGNLLRGTGKQIMGILMGDSFLPKVFEFTQNSDFRLQQEAFWIISNLAYGHPSERDRIFKNKAFISKLKTIVATASPDVAKEAGYVICNLIFAGDNNQVEMAIKNHQILESFPTILMLPQPESKRRALDAILSITKYNWKQNYVKYIEEAKLMEIVKNLAEEDEFSEKAKEILEIFSNNQNKEGQWGGGGF